MRTEAHASKKMTSGRGENVVGNRCQLVSLLSGYSFFLPPARLSSLPFLSRSSFFIPLSSLLCPPSSLLTSFLLLTGLFHISPVFSLLSIFSPSTLLFSLSSLLALVSFLFVFAFSLSLFCLPLGFSSMETSC